MRDALSHRGPDYAGLWLSLDSRVGLAQRRLAIVDLSPRSHQPMHDAHGVCHIVLNGEIYNHCELRRQLQAMGSSFRTTSDTEVLLEAYRVWGADCVTRLNGMFAFCVFDEREQHLFLARDRAGEKPLFYYQDAGSLLFASELKSLLAHPECPRVLDLEALEFYLTYGYVPGSMCILKGVQKLAPAHSMIYKVRDGQQCTRQYWRLPEPPDKGMAASPETLADELESLLFDSVKHQLQADVPVGILLSGGLDSSLITALATRVAGRAVKSVTVTFPDHSSCDEGPFARLVSHYFGTEHTEVVAEPTTVELLPRLAAQYDEPLADSSMVPTYLVSRAIREFATVALGGDGGDELFGGYAQHRWLQWLDQIADYMPSRIVPGVAKCTLPLLPTGMKGRNYIAAISSPDLMRLSCVGRLFDAGARRELLTPISGYRISPASSPEKYRATVAAAGRTVLQQATIADFKTYLPDDILVKVDRASMLNSLEVRAPWLDYRLIEFAFGRVPDELRATGRKTKVLPRILAQRLLPADLNLNRKQGFSLPLSSWFRGHWGRFFEDILLDGAQVLFDKRAVLKLLNAQKRGCANTERLFGLAMFTLWRQHYKVVV
jgi:asparagine synthase (glutamine-hydrolysing)